MRQGMFSVLGDITGARVADLCAGSGSLGIEALSRGAVHVTFVDSSPAAVAVIRANLASLGLGPRSTVITKTLERCGGELNVEPFDIIFCDAPWGRLPAIERALRKLLNIALLTRTGVLVLGHPAAQAPHPPGPKLELIDRRKWGDSGVSFFREHLTESAHLNP
jgi:16S rRNA (guanine966-N2)-methyltransferase